MDSGRLFIVHLWALSLLLAFVLAEAVSLPKPRKKKPSVESWDQPLGDIGAGYFSLNSGERPYEACRTPGMPLTLASGPHLFSSL